MHALAEAEPEWRPENGTQTTDMDWIRHLSTAIESPLAVLAPAGNLLTILAVWRCPALHTVANMYLVSLAVADFLVGALIPWKIVLTYMGRIVGSGPKYGECLLLNCSFFTLMTASALSITAISVDRMLNMRLCLHYPIYITHKLARIVIVAVWIVAFTVGAVPVLTASSQETHFLHCHIYYMQREYRFYQLYGQGGLFFVCSAVSFLCYGYIVLLALRHRRDIAKIAPGTRLGSFRDGTKDGRQRQQGGSRETIDCSCHLDTDTGSEQKKDEIYPVTDFVSTADTKHNTSRKYFTAVQTLFKPVRPSSRLIEEHSRDTCFNDDHKLQSNQTGFDTPSRLHLTSQSCSVDAYGTQDNIIPQNYHGRVTLPKPRHHEILHRNRMSEDSMQSDSFSELNCSSSVSDKNDLKTRPGSGFKTKDAFKSISADSNSSDQILLCPTSIPAQSETAYERPQFHNSSNLPKNVQDSVFDMDTFAASVIALATKEAATTIIKLAGQDKSKSSIRDGVLLQHGLEDRANSSKNKDAVADQTVVTALGSTTADVTKSGLVRERISPFSNRSEVSLLVENTPNKTAKKQECRKANNQNRRPSTTSGSRRMNHGCENKLKIHIRLYFLVFGLFFVLWSPTFLVLLFGVYADKKMVGLQVLFPIGLLNSVCNIPVYAWKCQNMRASMKKVLRDGWNWFRFFFRCYR